MTGHGMDRRSLAGVEAVSAVSEASGTVPVLGEVVLDLCTAEEAVRDRSPVLCMHLAAGPSQSLFLYLLRKVVVLLASALVVSD